MAEYQDKRAIDLILLKLPSDGGTIGNITFINIFEAEGLSSDQYKLARAELLSRGSIVARRGNCLGWKESGVRRQT